MSDETNIPESGPAPQPTVIGTPSPPAPVAPAAPVPVAPARRHPRPWMMVLGAVLAALLFMSIGAHLALGFSRHFGGGDFRRGYQMSVRGDMRGSGRGDARGFHGGQRFDANRSLDSSTTTALPQP